MAIDTQNKRRSASSRGPSVRIAPVPDGEIAGVDRQQIVGRYCGIAAAAPPVIAPGILPIYGWMMAYARPSVPAWESAAEGEEAPVLVRAAPGEEPVYPRAEPLVEAT